MSLLQEGQTGDSLKTSKGNAISEIAGHWIEKYVRMKCGLFLFKNAARTAQ